MDFKALKDLLFAKARANGLDEYEVFANTSSEQSAETLGHELQSVTSGTTGGICFRCAVGGRIGAASTQSTDQKEVLALVDRAMENAAVIDADEEPIFFAGSEAYSKKTCAAASMPGTGELRRAVTEVSERVFAADERVSESSAACTGAACVTVSLANSKGLDLTNEMGMQYAYVEAILQTEQESVDGFAFSQNIAGSDPDVAVKSVREAAGKLGSGRVKTGVYDIIFAADQVRALLSAFCGAFSGKAAMEGLSRLAGKEGTQVAVPTLTLIDDPFYPKNPMQTPFDAEGVATYRKNLIENGTLKTLLYDLTTAKKAGKTTTGNASRPSYDAPVSIAPYCMRIAGGSETPEAMRARMKDGLYITELKGLHAGANGVTGDFSIESAGFLVREGQLAAPVKTFTVAGNFFDLLMAIDGIADNVELGIPSLSVMAAPDILVRGLSVAGE